MSVITKTANQYVEETKQEIIAEDVRLWNNSMISELKQEHYESIIESLNSGDKITQEVYNEMIGDSDFMFEYFLNKQFLIHGINIIAK